MTRPVMLDDAAPHQIRLRFRAGITRAAMDVVVTCSCLPPHKYLAARRAWADPREPYRIWQAHARSVAA